METSELRGLIGAEERMSLRDLIGIKHSFTRENVTIAEERKDEPLYSELFKNSKPGLKQAVDLLTSPVFAGLIQGGFITLAAIKPHTEESNLGVENDLQGANKILGQIKDPLQVLFSITPPILTEKDLREFYPPEVWNALEAYQTVERFIKYMTSGTETFLVLFDENGNATAQWRAQVGSTDPKKGRTQGESSIRARFASDIRQNLVHGSLNPQEAQREICILCMLIQNIVFRDV